MYDLESASDFIVIAGVVAVACTNGVKVAAAHLNADAEVAAAYARVWVRSDCLNAVRQFYSYSSPLPPPPLHN